MRLVLDCNDFAKLGRFVRHLANFGLRLFLLADIAELVHHRLNVRIHLPRLLLLLALVSRPFDL